MVAAEEADTVRLAVSHTSISKDFDNLGDKCPKNGSENDPGAPSLENLLVLDLLS